MTAPRRRDMPPLPERVRSIHLIGICGTGMGSLAGMLAERGYDVRGSDAGAYPPMSTWLESRSIPIMVGYRPEHLAWDPDLVVVGNVCRKDNPEVLEAKRLGKVAISFPETLRSVFLSDRRSLVVTGTHGKTTTSALLTWMLEHGGLDPSFMVGGITGNFGGNFKLGQGPAFVVEGDEYDTAYFDKVPKFWHYVPFRATINNVEFDHGDIYPDVETIVGVFERFAAMLPPEGTLWVNGDDPRAVAIAEHATCAVGTFGFGPDNTLRAADLRHTPDGVEATIWRDGARLGTLRSPMAGAHNVRNVLGAAAIAMDEGLSWGDCVDALAAFRSVQKRQELKGVVDDILVYDDFAHHPTAVRETVQAIRARHPDRRLWSIFEAKSNTSRMAIFQSAYPAAFQGSDRVVLSAPWRKHKDTHLSDANKIDLPGVVRDLAEQGIPAEFIPNVADIVDHIATHAEPGDVILGMSGSNFGGFHDALLARLRADRAPDAPSDR